MAWLSSKKDNKKVKIDVEKNRSKFVSIIITDNGICRKAAEEKKNKKTIKRKSVGIRYTRQRLERFSKRFNNMYHIEIVDLHDENKMPSGTKVVTNIP